MVWIIANAYLHQRSVITTQNVHDSIKSWLESGDGAAWASIFVMQEVIHLDYKNSMFMTFDLNRVVVRDASILPNKSTEQEIITLT
ncbi:hypothetical protein D3C85_274610 [compost metagenome]